MVINQETKKVYSGYNVKVDMIIRNELTAAPSATSTAWEDSGSVLFVGTNFKSGASTEVTNKNGLGQQRPYATKQGYVGYTFSFDHLYTADAYPDDHSTTPVQYDPLELIDNGLVLDLRVQLLDGIGEDSASTADIYIVLAGCNVESSDFEVGVDSDASGSMSGKAESRTITPAV